MRLDQTVWVFYAQPLLCSNIKVNKSMDFLMSWKNQEHTVTAMMCYRSIATLRPVLQEKKTACLGDGCWKFEFFLCARKQALVCFGFYSFTHFCTEVDSSFNQFNYGRGSDFF